MTETVEVSVLCQATIRGRRAGQEATVGAGNSRRRGRAGGSESVEPA